MHRDVHDVLATTDETCRIVDQLHDVPPHEVYEVRVDGRRAVCKHDTAPTGTAGIEGRVTAFVEERTSLPVPSVFRVGEDYYLADWHSDAPDPDVDPVVDETWARAAGRALATLHDEMASFVDGYGRFEADGDTVASTAHGTWHDAALAYVRRHRSVPAANGHAESVDAVLDYLNAHPDAFAGADEAVCCHGWATPEHVAVDDGGVSCLVDFEHAIAAPGEYDYWRTVLPTFDADTASAGRAFRDAYESVRELPPGLDQRRNCYALLALVYYLESLYAQDQHDREATAERARWFRKRIHETLDELA